jgi:hypothetical protein
LFLISFLTLFITGCSISTLNVIHDNNNKSTTIDMGDEKTFTIQNSKMTTQNNASNSIYTSGVSSEIYTSDSVCSDILFQKLPRLEGNHYYSTFSKADVYNIYKDSSCSTDKIAKLEFHDCKKKFAITYEDSNEEGFRVEKRYLFIKDKECFNKIKNVFVEKQAK